jgi:anti-sigma regulatory factor (Ser/Thr protein kinase)
MDDLGRPRRVPDHARIAELQDAVLPKGLPVLPRVAIAARYLLAEDLRCSGGDWFDAIPLADGRVVVVVGDVVGHGVEAAVTVSELQALFEERVRLDGDLGAALDQLDARASRAPEARAATVCAAVVDPVSGEVAYCTAGHPPPVVVTAAGDASYLPTSGAGPLGSGGPFLTASSRLDEGELLFLYSDGLVGRPGRTPSQNTVDLLGAVGSTVRDSVSADVVRDEDLVERLCRRTMELLTQISGYSDDISLLALRVVPAVEPLHLRLPAVSEAVRSVRVDLGTWLAALEVADLDRVAVQHAVGELVSNVVRHAYPTVGDECPVTIGVRLASDGFVDLEVADEGQWQEPEAVSQTRGLAMVSGFLDEFHVERDHGTRARGRYRLTRPTALLRATSDGSPSPRARRLAPLRIGVVDDIVHVAGTADLYCSEKLRSALRRAARGGIRPVTVDLGEVDLLGSCAVRALLEAHDTGPVDLVAPLGSPAQHVLDLVHLPYRTSAV